MQPVEALIAKITPPDSSVAQAAQAHIDNLTKPLGALGRLEELALRLAVIRGSDRLEQPRPAVAVFAADHGVTEAGVSPYPREVTAQMVLNFLAGGAGINVLARQVGAEVRVVDVGVDFDFDDAPGLKKAKVARGTANLTLGPAMTQDQAVAAIMVGAETAAELIAGGCDLLVPGEMGIGNTTASACLTSVLTGRDPAQVTGRGAGLDDPGLANKTAMIQKALAANPVSADDPLGLLAALGGLEIAAICGYVLGAAGAGVPVMVDGFISTVGAALAAALCPAAKDYLLGGHRSVEIGHQALLDLLGLDPLLDMGMRLGEGTGGMLAVNLVRAAVAIYNEMATFESAGVSGKE